MAKRRTRGQFAGEYVEGEGDPEEINAPVEIESDPVNGIVRTNIRGNTSEIRGHRAAISVAYLQGQLLNDAARERYRNRRVMPVPKPIGRRVNRDAVPPGFVVCPECSAGLTDVWDCGRCEGRGIVRAEST